MDDDFKDELDEEFSLKKSPILGDDVDETEETKETEEDLMEDEEEGNNWDNDEEY